ncbi:MAG: Rne/Rng family ribonuclease [Pseudomonadota bacterium]
MKRMLINATQPEELRVAIVDGQKLYDLDIEVPSREQKKGNIYKGRVTRVEPSLDACFVDYGAGRHGFLPMKEISQDYHREGARSGGGKVAIKDAIKEGQEVVVQVEKEERGNKGAALTTFISLAGRYLVLMPNNPRAGGVSRRVEGDDRQQLKETLDALELEKGMGLIVRTAGVGRDQEELQWDLDYLRHLWDAIKTAAAERPAPLLIYQESSLIIRALRDYLRSDIGEILIDHETMFADAQEFMQQVMPHNLRKLKLYSDTTPLFSRFQIESQIESAYSREVQLGNGGSIVIDQTEALISIDINSARATKGGDIEETARQTNLEAAEEIARQLRIRDLGGLVVIDFIDMMDNRHQREVEDCLRKALRVDRARTQLGRISRFGLLEMSRQRLRPSLEESSQNVCPRCHGHGFIRGEESLALSVLRLVEEEVMKEYTGEVIAIVPTSVGNFLLNEKRHSIAQIEHRHRVPIMIVANQYMDTPNFEVRRVRRQDLTLDGETSYEMIKPPEPEIVAAHTPQGLRPATQEPAVARISPPQPAPVRTEPTTEPVSAAAKTEDESNGGVFAWFKQIFAAPPEKAPEPEEAQEKPAAKRDGAGSGGRRKKASKKAAQPRSKHPSQRRAGKKTGGRDESRTEKTKKAGSGKAESGEKPAAEGDDTQPAKSGRKRSRRGGRRGRGRSRGQKQTNEQQQNATNAGDGAEGKPSDGDASKSQSGDGSERQPRSRRGRGRSRGGRGGEAADAGQKADNNADQNASRGDGQQQPAPDAGSDKTARPPQKDGATAPAEKPSSGDVTASKGGTEAGASGDKPATKAAASESGKQPVAAKASSSPASRESRPKESSKPAAEAKAPEPARTTALEAKPKSNDAEAQGAAERAPAGTGPEKPKDPAPRKPKPRSNAATDAGPAGEAAPQAGKPKAGESAAPASKPAAAAKAPAPKATDKQPKEKRAVPSKPKASTAPPAEARATKPPKAASGDSKPKPAAAEARPAAPEKPAAPKASGKTEAPQPDNGAGKESRSEKPSDPAPRTGTGD